MWHYYHLGPFVHVDGFCWKARESIPGGDSDQLDWKSCLVLSENGRRLGPSGCIQLSDISTYGRGRFRHWKDEIFFSTSDGSDPSLNGNSYVARQISSRYSASAGSEINKLKSLLGPVTRDDLDAFIALADMCDAKQEFLRLSRQSMLDWQTLAALHLLAARNTGQILEIGPYLGAGTIAMGTATAQPIVSIELGGSHSHFELPSNDIIADLRRNLASHGIADRVTIIQGNVIERDTHVRALDAIGDRRIGLLMIDADGGVDRDMSFWMPYLADGCILVLDDYITLDNKGPKVASAVEELTRHGVVTQFGVYGYGTFIGQFHAGRQPAADKKYHIHIDAETHREGHCYIVPIPFGITEDEFVLLADGLPCPTPSSLHDDIRNLGDGRYSIWGNRLYFSTARNVDPTCSGTCFQIVSKESLSNSAAA
jgi:predicted O-methyltransferase YrrM